MKFVGLSIFLSSLFLSMMIYMLYTGNRIITTYEPLIEASKDLKFEATQAHLWFEEIISGDRAENIDSVWQHLDLAEWYAKAMLEGGKKSNYRIIALHDQGLRKEIQQVHKNLTKFRKIAELRYKIQIQSGPGSAVDQEFDQVFRTFITGANRVEVFLHNKIQADLADFRATGLGLLVAATLLAFFISAILLKYRQRNTRQIAKIKAAKRVIEEKNEKLQAMAHYDFLTNLPNRLLLTELLTTAIVKAQRNQQWLVLFFIDLDHFKSVNDSFGHQAGDTLLQLVAERLSTILRAEDYVARLAGDEFTLLLSPEETQQQALDCATSVAKKVQAQLSDSFYIEETEVFISASIGIALYPKDGDSADSILKNADRSMYDVKQMGKNNYRFFSAELEDSTQHKLQMESDLRKAIPGGELELYYQPQWNFKTGKLFGLEALVRWNHPQKGMLFPDEFIGVAEKSGLIYQLDMWVFEAACQQLKRWESNGKSPEQLSINMSAVQFSTPGLVEKLAVLLAQYEIKPNKLEIEIVESILMQDSKYTLMTLAAIKEMGIRIAVDDFGTGYSSMAYLSKFPIDALKIDRSFVIEIDTSAAAKVIIESIIQMGSKLGLNVVAEGIETAEQNRFLAGKGCTFAQGYFYNKPMSVEDVEALLIEEEK